MPDERNARLKRLLADAMLDNAALKDLLGKKVVTPAGKRQAVAHLVEGQACDRHAGTDDASVDTKPALVALLRTVATVTTRLEDLLPEGFVLRGDSARLDGVAVSLAGTGRRIMLEPVIISPGQTRVLSMNVLVSSSVRPGRHTNTVQLYDYVTGDSVSDKATATVRVLADPVFQCATVLGRVFDDRDQNGHMSQSSEERGLPNVRMVAPNGLAITTDEFGRFNVPCAALPQAIGSNFMLKLDERTLPSGYRLTTENPRVVRLTPGMITRLDFGATLAPLVRIDLAANAFARDPTGVEILVPELRAGLRALVAEISDTATMLRMTYVLDHSEGDQIARRRLKLTEGVLRELWRSTGRYKLNIETRLERLGDAP